MKVNFYQNQNFKGILPVSKFPGKHKLPRYLYHFTDSSRLKDILREGAIKGSSSIVFEGESVYMVDMNNLLKYWKADGSWNEFLSFFGNKKTNTSIAYALLKQASKNNRDIVCLRIQTKGLEPDKLRIRSQNRLFNSSDKYLSHCENGDSALNKGLYNQRKEALEYIYGEMVPAKDFEVIGGAKLSIISRIGLESDYNNQHKLFLKTLLKVFRDKPEGIGVKNELRKMSLFERIKSFFRDVF